MADNVALDVLPVVDGQLASHRLVVSRVRPDEGASVRSRRQHPGEAEDERRQWHPKQGPEAPEEDESEALETAEGRKHTGGERGRRGHDDRGM